MLTAIFAGGMVLGHTTARSLRRNRSHLDSVNRRFAVSRIQLGLLIGFSRFELLFQLGVVLIGLSWVICGWNADSAMMFGGKMVGLTLGLGPFKQPPRVSQYFLGEPFVIWLVAGETGAVGYGYAVARCRVSIGLYFKVALFFGISFARHWLGE